MLLFLPIGASATIKFLLAYRSLFFFLSLMLQPSPVLCTFLHISIYCGSYFVAWYGFAVVLLIVVILVVLVPLLFFASTVFSFNCTLCGYIKSSLENFVENIVPVSWNWME